MKTSLFKITAPALAIGLALSAQGGVYAAGPNAETQAKANTEVNVGQKNFLGVGASLTHRLAPIDNRISSVDFGVAELSAELEATESLTFEEYFFYEEQLTSYLNRLNASTNQLEAVTKKFDEDSAEVTEVEVALDASLTATLEAQNLLNSIDVIEELPDVEEPIEEPIEEPVTP